MQNMKIVVIGGGKVGHYLAASMLERKNRVTVIEADRNRAERLADLIDTEVIFGDGTDPTVLKAAGVEQADCVVAVTGSDETNLVAVQLAKECFHVGKTIARTNNPRNLDTMRALGVDIPVSSTGIIARLIEQEIGTAEMHLLATLNKGRASICTIVLPENSRLHQRCLKDIDLPSSSLIVSIVRGNQMIIPNGSTILQAGDEVVSVCEGASQMELLKALKHS